MPPITLHRFPLILAVIVALTMSLGAQIPDTLWHTFPGATAAVQTGAQLGYSVTASSSFVAAGVPWDDTLAEDSGVVKVFNSATGTLLYTLINPTPGTGDGFGKSVVMSGTRLCVGAPGDTSASLSSLGSVYVYDLAGATPAQPLLTIHNATPYSGFGAVLASSGSSLCVGGGLSSTGGIVAVYDLNGATPTTAKTYLIDNDGLPSLFGMAVAISGSMVVVGAPGFDSMTGIAGKAYVYDLSDGSPVSQSVLTLFRSSRSTAGMFGAAVAIDGTRIVVGDPEDNTGADDAGALHVYDISGQLPDTPTLKLNNPHPVASDHFGAALSLVGTQLAVGARQDDTGATDTGSAYVYDLGGTTPTVPTSTLHNPSPAAADNFGGSLALTGTRLLVGACLDDMGAADAGTAYVFDFTSGTPTVPVLTLNNPGFQPGYQYGSALALSGTQFVVGAPYEDTGASDAGSAYVYDLASSTPAVPVHTLHNPTPAANDLFGGNVAMSGTRVAVVAKADDTGASNAGCIYIYDLGGATPDLLTLTITNPTPGSGDYFGRPALSATGRWLVVGVPNDDTVAVDAGSAYVYDLESATPTVPVVTLNKPAAVASDYFGISVAISGTRVVVGADGDDTGAYGAGSAYVFDLSSATPTLPVAVLNNPDPAVYDDFGYPVAIDGAKVIVGASGDDVGAVDAGSVYVYDLDTGTPTAPVMTLNNPDPAVNDHFGSAVTIDGMKVIVGVSSDDPGAINAGSAYVYDLSGLTPSQPIATLNNPDPRAGDGFGSSLAIDGSTIVIGEPYKDTASLDAGAAFIFGPADGDTDGLRDTWEIARFGTQYGHGAADDDDHDGITNLVEMAFGLNPLLPSGGNLTPAALEGDFLTLTLTKQPGVNYEVQSAGTLLPSLPDSFSPSSTTVLINDATTLKVRDNTPILTTPTRFMRVQVSGAP